MRLLCTLLMFCLISVSQAQTPFDWLQGNWQNQKNGSIEAWEQTGDKLIGRVFKVQESDTISMEKLQVKYLAENWYYIAEVSHNAEPTKFKMTTYKTGHFVCENPEHDFPKKITYNLDGAKLKVIISDDEQAIPFNFVKVNE